MTDEANETRPIVLYVDSGEESAAAQREMEAARIEFDVYYQEDGILPAVDTGFRLYEGLTMIRTFILPNADVRAENEAAARAIADRKRRVATASGS